MKLYKRIKKHMINLTGTTEIWTCDINGQPVDFVFDDLSESANYSKKSGLAKMACAKLSQDSPNGKIFGRIDGKNCRDIDADACNKLSPKLNAKGLSGAHYDVKHGGCILDVAVTERNINLTGEILAGVALTLVTDGATVIPVLVSIGTDLAFEAVQNWQETIPYDDFQEFMAKLNQCYQIKPGKALNAATGRAENLSKEDAENSKKVCVGDTLNNYYGLMAKQVDALAPDVADQLIAEVKKAVDIIGDEEVAKIDLAYVPKVKNLRNNAQWALMGGLLIFNPEKMLQKGATKIDDFIRLSGKLDDKFDDLLREFKNTGITHRFSENALSQQQWDFINQTLRSDDVVLVDVVENGRRMKEFRTITQPNKSLPLKTIVSDEAGRIRIQAIKEKYAIKFQDGIGAGVNLPDNVGDIMRQELGKSPVEVKFYNDIRDFLTRYNGTDIGDFDDVVKSTPIDPVPVTKTNPFMDKIGAKFNKDFSTKPQETSQQIVKTETASVTKTDSNKFGFNLGFSKKTQETPQQIVKTETVKVSEPTQAISGQTMINSTKNLSSQFDEMSDKLWETANYKVEKPKATDFNMLADKFGFEGYNPDSGEEASQMLNQIQERRDKVEYFIKQHESTPLGNSEDFKQLASTFKQEKELTENYIEFLRRRLQYFEISY